jgi:hypothetical protein
MGKGAVSKLIYIFAVAVTSVYVIKLIMYSVVAATAMTLIYFAIRALFS